MRLLRTYSDGNGEPTYVPLLLSVSITFQGHGSSLLVIGVSPYADVPHDAYLYYTERENTTAAQGANTLHPDSTKAGSV